MKVASSVSGNNRGKARRLNVRRNGHLFAVAAGGPVSFLGPAHPMEAEHSARPLRAVWRQCQLPSSCLFPPGKSAGVYISAKLIVRTLRRGACQNPLSKPGVETASPLCRGWRVNSRRAFPSGARQMKSPIEWGSIPGFSGAVTARGKTMGVQKTLRHLAGDFLSDAHREYNT